MNLTLLEETRVRLACCKANTGDGWGEVRSLRNHMMSVDRRLGVLTGFTHEIEGLPELDPLRQDEVTVGLVQEYWGLLAAKKAVCAYLGIESPVVAAVIPDNREPFKDFLARLLG